MTSTVTTLLEKAMGSDSDAERLACLNQAKRLYRGEGIALPRRVVREQTTVPASTTPMITVKEHQAKVDELERDRVRLLKDNAALSAENTRLRSEKLTAATAQDDEVLADVKKKIRQAAMFGAFGWIAACGAIVVLAVVLI